MVRSQHQAWNERLAARARLIKARGEELRGGRGEGGGGGGEGTLQGSGRGGGSQCGEREGESYGMEEGRHCSLGQPDPMSIHTLSSRY